MSIDRYLLTNYYYWLPRARIRINTLIPHKNLSPWGKESIPETSRQLNNLKLNSELWQWLVVQVRLEMDCKYIYQKLERR